MFLPSFDDVMEIHNELAEMFREDSDPIEPPGARDEHLVHSACHRPHTGIGNHDKYVSVFDKAAALFHSLTQNHAFHNGNKRTALVTLLATLYRNNRIMDYNVSDDLLYEMTVAVANGSFLGTEERLEPDMAVEQISIWLRSNTMARNPAPSDMRADDFFRRCEINGCTVRPYSGGKLIIYGQKGIKISSDTRQFSGKVAKSYLSTLGLTLGQTGKTFPEFQNVDDPEERRAIYKYMSALRQLAKI
ncbi:MAG: type II toxin-antitoxin system death-on-curing family toxin [Alphaproteobacteria bacterium]|nr:type II toxin-antitoxin system death-on-curing family toxin [Alphaproteobacteria bacterium]